MSDNNKIITVSELPYSFVQKTGAVQTFVNGVWTRINYTDIIIENGISFNLTTDEWTIPEDGIYGISAGMVWFGVSVGSRGCRILVNGVAVSAGLYTVVNIAGGGNSAKISDNFPLFSGDLVAVEGFQNSGGGLNSVNFGYMPYAMIVRLGDL